jgi:NAD(P)-dependent dehydrogenase (short-subunit alcohol dehydrogenase family)
MNQINSLARFSLEGRIAVVTGAAQGIGRAIALGLAGAGARVACLDLKAPACEDTAAQIRASGGDAIAIATDVSSESDTSAAIAKVKTHWGALHVLVHGAAAADPSGSVVEYSLDEWNRVIAVNLTGAFLMSKSAIPLIAQSGGGSVILIASQLARVGSSRRAVYCAIKGGLLNLARAMAIDHAPEKIRVNTLSPGAIETERMPLRFGTMEAAREALGPLHLTGTLGQPEDIASAAIYLASDASSFVTGADLLVDGGYTAR